MVVNVVDGVGMCDVCGGVVVLDKSQDLWRWLHDKTGMPLCGVRGGEEPRSLEECAAAAEKSGERVASKCGVTSSGLHQPTKVLDSITYCMACGLPVGGSAAAAAVSGEGDSVSGVGPGEKSNVAPAGLPEPGANGKCPDCGEMIWNIGGVIYHAESRMECYGKNSAKGSAAMQYGETGPDMNPETGCISNEGMREREALENFPTAASYPIKENGLNICKTCRRGAERMHHSGWRHIDDSSPLCGSVLEAIKKATEAASIRLAGPNDVTLRDQFAMAALTGVSSSSSNLGTLGNHDEAEACVFFAYQIADAMLKARKP